MSCRLGLNQKLIISFTSLAFFVLLSVLFVANYFLDKQFSVYMTHKQNMKNGEIVSLILKNFSEDGTPPDETFLKGLANTLLEQGIVMMLYGKDDSLKFCIHSPEKKEYSEMLRLMEEQMRKRDPQFSGTYTEKRFVLQRNGMDLGSVWLGYYGPFYYSESDQNFLNDLNKVLSVIGFLSFVFSVGAGWLIADKISEPLKKVTERTRRIAEGDYVERVNLVTHTMELDDLSLSIDHLAQSLETQLALKKRLANAYSHEFRTPLAILQSNVEAMIDGLWEPTNERLESLLAEIRRLSRLVSEIDNLVEIKGASKDIEKKLSDISQMTDDLLVSFEAHIRDKELHVRHQKSNCTAIVHRDKIRQLIINLISNAVKYTRQGGNILIKTYCIDNRAVFSITDDGMGISPKDLPHIFDYLYRTDESRTRNTGGAGIGLSVVQAIVESHGGTIHVESNLGEGTTFTVVI